MGLFRLLLALAVVSGHSWQVEGLSMLSPQMAVVIFFAISGFYMDLVLRTKYEATPRGTRLFWTNRLLRLFPTYWTILITTSLIYGGLAAFGSAPVAATFRANFPWLQGQALGSLEPLTLLFLVLVNVMILFQDVTLFLLIGAGGSLNFTHGMSGVGSLPAEKFLLVPQAWSLSLELMFYALAPWLLRRSGGLLVAVVVASLLLRAGLDSFGLQHDPWSYRFFPTELAAFGAGALAHRAAEQFRGRPPWRARTRVLQTAAALLIVFNGRVDSAFERLLGGSPLHGSTIAHGLAFGAVVASMPFVFEITSRSRLDAFLGDLSYPLYLVHLAVLQVGGILAQVYARQIGWLDQAGTPYLTLLAVAVSLGLVLAVDRPIDARRQRRVKASSARSVRQGAVEAAEAGI